MLALWSVCSKLILTGFGLALLWSVSGGYRAPVVLVATVAISHGMAYWLARPSFQAWRPSWFVRLPVPLAFLLLVMLNVLGLIGTLTGAQSSVVAGQSNPLIAMPFYLLAVAAVLSDVCSGRLTVPRPLDYLVYIAMPFKLLAGPLEGPRLLSKIERFRIRFRWLNLMAAWPWVALGAVMKYVIANRLDPARQLVFVDPLTSFVTAAVFELKFYFDFAGYSFLAYGGALALGLRITQNFNHPFLAANVVLFWRAWHISLGRFLARYVLEPNLSLWTGRQQKVLFASGIFLVSAMWHGGTLNYLLWGVFHAVCYHTYVTRLKRINVPLVIGLMSMLLFFVFGRMLAIDADGQRLIRRLSHFLLPSQYSWALGSPDHAYFSSSEIRGLILAAAFLAAEVISNWRWPRARGYHMLRRPWSSLLLTLLFICFGLDKGSLLYARV